MNSKRHAVTEVNGRPISILITARQVSDYTDAARFLNNLPDANWLLVDRGYDEDWFRKVLKERGIEPYIFGRKSRKKRIKYDKQRYKRRHRIERMFGNFNDWRRVATCYDRYPNVFMSAIELAAVVLF